MLRNALAAALTALLLVGQAAHAQTESPPAYELFVVAEDVEVQYINGVMRFCQRRNLKGIICGQYEKVFGKKTFTVGNWWDAHTFAQAYTRRENIKVTRVAPGPDGASLVIYYRPTN
jgi:hypothetical protein